MKFPWQRRAERAEADAEKAQERLSDVEADWRRVRDTVDTTREERDLNGWTATVESLFSGRRTP
jgi:hypothetical protein